MSTPQIILASQSPQRKNLLATLGIEFEVIPADIDEKAAAAKDLNLRAESIAVAKAEKIAASYPKAIIIAADTFTVLNGQIFEKPVTLAEAKVMLQKMSGQTIADHTGLCFLAPHKQLRRTETVITLATFRILSEKEIENYVTNNPVLTWAAGFSPAYTAGMGLIADVHGSPTGLSHGLPIERVADFLRSAGVQF